MNSWLVFWDEKVVNLFVRFLATFFATVRPSSSPNAGVRYQPGFRPDSGLGERGFEWNFVHRLL